MFRTTGRILKALAKIASNEVSRPILGRLNIEGGRMVATDGKILATIEAEDLDGIEKEYPAEPFRKGRVTDSIAIGETAEIESRRGARTAVEPETDGGMYPNYATAVASATRDDVEATVSLRAEYLRKLADLAEAVCKEADIEFPTVRLHIRGGRQATSFEVREVERKAGYKVSGIIMPVLDLEAEGES